MPIIVSIKKHRHGFGLLIENGYREGEFVSQSNTMYSIVFPGEDRAKSWAEENGYTVISTAPDTIKITDGENNPQMHSFPNGMTVKELKELIKNWPETDEFGEDTEVFVEADGYSMKVYSVTPCNKRTWDDGSVSCDISFDTETE